MIPAGPFLQNDDAAAHARIPVCPPRFSWSFYKQMFEPKLPYNKTIAIERLGFGLVDKFFFIFESPVFEDDAQGLQILWKNGENLRLPSVRRWNIQVIEIINTFFKLY